MDKKELEEGAKEEKKKGGEVEAKAEGKSFDLKWIMDNLGPFFNNNEGLAELLLDRLNERGADTEGAALQMMVSVLKRFNQEYKAIGEIIGSGLDRLDDVSDETEDLAEKLKEILRDMGKDVGDESASVPEGLAPEGGGGGDAGAAATPPIGTGAGAAPVGGEMPLDMGAGAMPMDMGAAGGAMPMDLGAAGGMGAAPEVPPMDTMAGGAMPMDIGGGQPPLPSDERVKNVRRRHVLSDEDIKNVARKKVAEWQEARPKKISPDIIEACSKGVS